MSKTADDLAAIKKSNDEAVKKARTQPDTRTPDASKNNNGKYPLRTVQDYIGGHRQVFDSTPGYRVVETMHGSGTFKQWSEDGTEISVIVGNKFEHLKQGYTLTVNQNGDIKIDGHCRVSVGGGAHIEVKGDVSLVSTGSISHFAAKDYNIIAGGSVNIVGRKSLNMSTDGTHKVMVTKDHKLTVKGNSENFISGNFENTIGANETKSTRGKVDHSAGASMSFTAPVIKLNE